MAHQAPGVIRSCRWSRWRVRARVNSASSRTRSASANFAPDRDGSLMPEPLLGRSLPSAFVLAAEGIGLRPEAGFRKNSACPSVTSRTD